MDDDLFKAIRENVLLREYVGELKRKTSIMPKYFDKLSVQELSDIRKLAAKDPTTANLIYRAGSSFVHINALVNMYVSIEKKLTDIEKVKMALIKEAILDKASAEENVESKDDLERVLYKLFDQSVELSERKARVYKNPVIGKLMGGGRVPLSAAEHDIIKYYLRRDIVGFGPIEPLIVDNYIEDIHLIGTSRVRVSHKAFQYALETNLQFDDETVLNDYFVAMSERMGRPVSASRPIIDGTLPDGSRINMIYTNEISAQGSSFTIRKFSSEPISPIQLVKWKTFSAEFLAYLWLCLENKQNVIICGETASGKTTTINAVLTLIDHRGKIYSVEDTPEVKPPQKSWQRCVTREAGPEEARVSMFDLLRAALRSRPDYIVIGEIRGEEARTAFQCMQTGIPVMATFHASNATKFIQRMTGQPVNIPLSFIDNVNVLIFQSAINVQGRSLRRVTNVEEFVGFNREVGGVNTRNVFKWDASRDVMQFRGMNNSH
ncbi:MAG: type II/IV secretion system ATPase subunit, partial [Methanomassiliicoccales archaeon]|nr:type II/IV secretion system ATPase subunit [Methanomassiliicoccales archaeon]